MEWKRNCRRSFVGKPGLHFRLSSCSSYPFYPYPGFDCVCLGIGQKPCLLKEHEQLGSSRIFGERRTPLEESVGNYFYPAQTGWRDRCGTWNAEDHCCGRSDTRGIVPPKLLKFLPSLLRRDQRNLSSVASEHRSRTWRRKH